jgi:hypothetical protein
MSDATGIDIEDMPEDKESYLEEGSDQQSGGEAEVKEQIQEEEDVEEEISEILNSDDFISKPFLSKKCTVPEDILVFQYPLFSGPDTVMTSDVIVLYKHFSL